MKRKFNGRGNLNKFLDRSLKASTGNMLQMVLAKPYHLWLALIGFRAICHFICSSVSSGFAFRSCLAICCLVHSNVAAIRAVFSAGDIASIRFDFFPCEHATVPQSSYLAVGSSFTV
jgi:hypothetical protein